MSSTREHDIPPMAGSPLRRRPRQDTPRPRTVRFDLTEEEFAELEQAASRAGLAKGAYAAEASLAAARGRVTAPGEPFREALSELITASSLVRRIGVLLNQAVAKLNATGQRPRELDPCAQACLRRVERLDEAADQMRKAIGWHPRSV
jgi:hypothetical protein